MSTLIMKFGGTSVGMTMGLTQLLSIVLYERERWDRLMLVVSALDGVTDQLIEAAHLALLNNRRGYRRIVATLRTRHLALIEYLPLGITERNALQADIDRLLFDMLDVCQNMPDNLSEAAKPEAIDRIISTGERLAARIVAALLRQNNLRGVAIDATDVIITDNVFGNATPDLTLTRDRIAANLLPLLNRGIIPVITGFIGATVNGKTTTLGRGGSDYTASIVGVCSDAQEVWVWTDVDGMMTTDPRIVPGAWKVKEISFDEASELAYFGAKVLHPLTVLPAVEKNIPVYILNSRNPKGTGTRITREARPCKNLIKSIAYKRGITIITVSSSRMLMAHGFLRALFEVFDRHHTSVDMVATSEVSVSLTLDNVDSLNDIVEDLSQLGDVKFTSTNALICLVGNNLKYTPGVARRAFGSLSDINILMVSHGASNINFSFLIDEKDASAAVQRLHTEFFSETDAEVFEPAG